jgi:hypothetical protein
LNRTIVFLTRDAAIKSKNVYLPYAVDQWKHNEYNPGEWEIWIGSPWLCLSPGNTTMEEFIADSMLRRWCRAGGKKKAALLPK